MRGCRSALGVGDPRELPPSVPGPSVENEECGTQLEGATQDQGTPADVLTRTQREVALAECNLRRAARSLERSMAALSSPPQGAAGRSALMAQVDQMMQEASGYQSVVLDAGPDILNGFEQALKQQQVIQDQQQPLLSGLSGYAATVRMKQIMQAAIRLLLDASMPVLRYQDTAVEEMTAEEKREAGLRSPVCRQSVVNGGEAVHAFEVNTYGTTVADVEDEVSAEEESGEEAAEHEAAEFVAEEGATGLGDVEVMSDPQDGRRRTLLSCESPSSNGTGHGRRSLLGSTYRQIRRWRSSYAKDILDSETQTQREAAIGAKASIPVLDSQEWRFIKTVAANSAMEQLAFPEGDAWASVPLGLEADGVTDGVLFDLRRKVSGRFAFHER